MSKIALSVDYMKLLEALGIDTSRASMSYLCVWGVGVTICGCCMSGGFQSGLSACFYSVGFV